MLQVSEARIVDIPRILRLISEEEVIARQKQRRYLLFNATVGWAPDKEGSGWSLDRTRILPMALLIWQQRIENYHRFKLRGEAVLEMGSNSKRRRGSLPQLGL